MSNASYRIDDQDIKVAANEGSHQLHGGPNGLHQRVWQGEAVVDVRGPSVQLECTHEHGTDGYVGNLLVRARFTISACGELFIEYTGLCDQPRPVSLTSHPYFGFENERATHLLAVDSVQQLAVDEERLPTGRILDVSETSADFTQPRPAQSEPLDNSYVFNADGNVRPRARLSSDSMTLEVHSDQPVLQVYVSHDAATDETWVCLEPHGYVDATRHPEFESIVLYPNQLYRHCTRMCWRLNDSI